MTTSRSVFVVLSVSGVLTATVWFGVFCDDEFVATEGLVFASSLVSFPQGDKRRNKRTETLGEHTHEQGKQQTSKDRHRHRKDVHIRFGNE